MKVTVNEGWQLGLPDGKLRYGGETFDAPDELAREWISGGQAVAAKKASELKAVVESKNKAVQESENKAVSPERNK